MANKLEFKVLYAALERTWESKMSPVLVLTGNVDADDDLGIRIKPHIEVTISHGTGAAAISMKWRDPYSGIAVNATITQDIERLFSEILEAIRRSENVFVTVASDAALRPREDREIKLKSISVTHTASVDPS